MPYMLVTLDVSKLNGWLNLNAPCRATRGGVGGDMRSDRRAGVGQWRCKQHAGRGPQLDIEDKARARRTSNMPVMSVTLDVSKLSGWLNAVS